MKRVTLEFSRRCKPTDNAFVDSFDGNSERNAGSAPAKWSRIGVQLSASLAHAG
jgi:hypothetical protein